MQALVLASARPATRRVTLALHGVIHSQTLFVARGRLLISFVHRPCVGDSACLGCWRCTLCESALLEPWARGPVAAWARSTADLHFGLRRVLLERDGCLELWHSGQAQLRLRFDLDAPLFAQHGDQLRWRGLECRVTDTALQIGRCYPALPLRLFRGSPLCWEIYVIARWHDELRFCAQCLGPIAENPSCGHGPNCTCAVDCCHVSFACCDLCECPFCAGCPVPCYDIKQL
jgi:hypothetical protein